MTLLVAGISSGATAALFYASRVADVPAVFMAEPDDIQVLPCESPFLTCLCHRQVRQNLYEILTTAAM